jgi:hypothetical protein
MEVQTDSPPNPDILQRLESFLDPADQTETPEDARDTKSATEEIPIPVQEPGEDPPPVAAETSEEPVKADPDASESEVAAAAEVSDDEINTFSDLAKMFEVEETVLMDHLRVDAGDGEPVSLSKVISTYKNAPDAVRRWETLEGERATFHQEVLQLRETTDAQVRELAVHAQVLLDMTQEEFGGVDWERLKVEDTTQYLVLKDKQRERGQAITAAIEKLKVVDQQRQGATPGTMKDQVAEMASLHRKMPEWREKDVAHAAMEMSHAYLTEDIGFTQAEVNSIEDHRYLLVVHDAAQWRNLQKKAPEKLATLRNLPKPKAVLRSTARRDGRQDSQKKVTALRDRLAKTGDTRDAGRLIEELM